MLSLGLRHFCRKPLFFESFPTNKTPPHPISLGKGAVRLFVGLFLFVRYEPHFHAPRLHLHIPLNSNIGLIIYEMRAYFTLNKWQICMNCELKKWI